MTSRNSVVLVSVCLFWWYWSPVIMADNGKVALAQPVRNITIDGDLSDWPKAIKADGFQETNGVAQADLDPLVRAAYDLAANTLYVALEITDDSHVPCDDTHPSWNDCDSHLLYIDMDHAVNGSGPLLFSAINTGTDYVQVTGSWDPKVAKGHGDMAESVQKRVDGVTVYEWRIKPDHKLEAGMVIGIDHLINDVDLDDEGKTSRTTAIWGQFYGKSRRSARLGDLVLVDPKQKTGTLKGVMRWHQDVTGMNTNGWRVRIQSVKRPAFWVQPRLDEQGAFEMDLPVGAYKITSPFPIYGDRNQHILTKDLQVRAKVRAGKTTEAEPLVLTTVDPPELPVREGLLFSFEGKADEKRVDRFIKEHMAYYEVPGVSVALIRDGEAVYTKNFGVANQYTQAPVTDNILFEAGSITKIAFAFAVHRLAERGVIDLDQPLHEILPFEAIAHDNRYRLITGRHVLTHQTGFPNWAYQNDDGKLDIKFTPGTNYGYSGEGFEYLGRVVAHITKKDLNTILREEVLIPMGFAHNTHFSDQGQLLDVTANGHLLRRPRIPMNPQQVGVAWSMHSNARAMTPFMTSLMARKGLSAETYEGILTPMVENPNGALEGLGWKSYFSLGFQVRNTPYGRSFGHGGSNGGNECIFEIYDEKNAGFIVTTNADTGRPFFQAFRRFIVAGK